MAGVGTINDACMHVIHFFFSSKASAEPFLSGSSSSYLEQMYESWQTDPNSVHKVERRLIIFHEI